jgi:hypothetical protein
MTRHVLSANPNAMVSDRCLYHILWIDNNAAKSAALWQEFPDEESAAMAPQS